MWAACVIRFFRKKIVLGIIFVLSLTYCILSIALEADDDYHENMVDTIPVRKLDGAFLWKSSPETVNDTDLKVVSCRNSVQGKVLIVDDKGYVCSRSDLLSTGCCDILTKNIQRYSCETCKENGCCSVYEYCVSCCLHPDKKILLQSVLGKASDTFRVLFSSVTDHYELCLAKCRTSSLSVQHENSYRDPRAKHCYGENPPISSDAQGL